MFFMWWLSGCMVDLGGYECPTAGPYYILIVFLCPWEVA